MRIARRMQKIDPIAIPAFAAVDIPDDALLDGIGGFDEPRSSKC